MCEREETMTESVSFTAESSGKRKIGSDITSIIGLGHLLSSLEHSLNSRTAHWLLNVFLVRPFVAQTGRKYWGHVVCPHVAGFSHNTDDINTSQTNQMYFFVLFYLC